MNRFSWLLIALIVVQATAVDTLVWSLVLGNPVIDAKDDDSGSYEKDSLGTDGVRSATNRRQPSRPTRHHHGQVTRQIRKSEMNHFIHFSFKFKGQVHRRPAVRQGPFL
jgi:hypothetical protein